MPSIPGSEEHFSGRDALLIKFWSDQLGEVLLTTSGLSKYFGALAALHKVELTVRRGQIHGLIGPNGAGKTTFANVVSGLLPSTEGKIYFDGTDITGVKPYIIVKRGLSRTFQRGQIFPGMTCLQNVMVGRHYRIRSGFLRTAFRLPFARWTEEDITKQQSLELLQFVGLPDVAEHWASDLVWVECQLLQIARALASKPKLLILDEPSAGMGIEESQTIGKIIRQVRDSGITIVLIGHDVELIMGVADWITVLNFGEKIYEGTPSHVRSNSKVLEAYFGTEKSSSES